MSEDRIDIHLSIEGRVQGVGFRAWLEDVARAQGVDGWVRNRRDGSVEAVVAGTPPAVHEVVRQVREGPALARVTTVRETPAEVPAAPGFRQLPTA